MSVSPAQSRPVNVRIYDACANDACADDDKPRRRAQFEFVRGGQLVRSDERLNVEIWKVEHLTLVELIKLQDLMLDRGMHILCMRETYLSGADSYLPDEGF